MDFDATIGNIKNRAEDIFSKLHELQTQFESCNTWPWSGSILKLKTNLNVIRPQLLEQYSSLTQQLNSLAIDSKALLKHYVPFPYNCDLNDPNKSMAIRNTKIISSWDQFLNF
jgi:hypothetical protein